MGAKQITPMSEVDAYLEEQIQRIEQQTIYKLSYVGERCLNEARSTNSYIDQTGNLRSSTGYVIVKDGKIVQMSDFTTVKNGREGSQGGAAFARQLVKEFPSGIVLIVVAGMNYAAHVSARGYNVLDSAELLAEQLVPSLMKQLGFTKR